MEGDQRVILGAGWDTRAYGLLKGRGATIFEVDAPGTQAVKRRAIEKSHVTFVSCDFNRQVGLDGLTEHGFDPTIRTFILWEGVTMYLDEQAMRRTLHTVSTLPSGSRIAFDFFSREWLEDTVVAKMGRWAIQATYGEPLIFGFPVTPDFTGRLSDYLEETGLALERARPVGQCGSRG